MGSPRRPVRIAVVDDYDVIVKGTAALLQGRHDVVVVEPDTDGDLSREIDVALIDSFGGGEAHVGIADLVKGHPNVARVAVYTWNLSPRLVEAAFKKGATSYLSKGLGGPELAEALVATHKGRRVVSTPMRVSAQENASRRRWPGQDHDLTEREAEVLAFITRGRKPREIAEEMYLFINSVKTHMRNVYRKIGVNDRTGAALWGVDNGFRASRTGRKDWAPDPT